MAVFISGSVQISGSVASGPSIVTNGLTLYLDASNNRSYPGSGNKWYDISGYQNHFTLVGSPTLSPGYLSFNGSSQYAICDNTTCGNFGIGSFTLDYILTTKSSGGNYKGATIAKRYALDLIGGANRTGWGVSDSINQTGIDSYFISQTQNTTVPNTDNTDLTVSPNHLAETITHYTYTITRTNNGVTNVIRQYVNGTLKYTSPTRTFTLGNYSLDNALNLTIMKTSVANYYERGNLYAVRLYNKALSAAEITQNYTAMKLRFFGAF